MNDHQVQMLDLSVPQENAAFTNQTRQLHMLLYNSSMSMDVYKEDDKRFCCELMHYLFPGLHSF
jgi:hypothetical protein